MNKLASACMLLGVVLAGAVPAVAEGPAGSLAALSTQPSMNVFRRFAVDRARMIDFYGDALGLKQLPSLRLGGGNEMILFEIGTAQVKLQATPAASQYPGGSVKDATGLRVFTFFYPDEAALTAMVLDPEKQWVELVVLPGAPAETYRRFEVGITASNVEKSREFYRSFVGLEELPAIADPVLGATRYPFRHGATTINVWSFGQAVPANKSSAGIQYVVNNVETVDAKAKAAAVTIDRPLGPFGQGLRTIWLADPDGVTNYFAQILPRDRPAAVPATQ